jgi:hypothetical protein
MPIIIADHLNLLALSLILTATAISEHIAAMPGM